MNPRVYYGSKINEDPQYFLDEVHKILCAMGVSEEEKVSWLHTNSKIRLRCCRRCDKVVEYKEKSPSLRTFSKLHSWRGSIQESRERIFEDFINLRHGGMLVNEYSVKLFKLSK